MKQNPVKNVTAVGFKKNGRRGYCFAVYNPMFHYLGLMTDYSASHIQINAGQVILGTHDRGDVSALPPLTDLPEIP